MIAPLVPRNTPPPAGDEQIAKVADDVIYLPKTPEPLCPLLAIVPLVAILPILLYIGLVIGAQAFEATPARHAPAVILALLPNIANWCQSQIDGALVDAYMARRALDYLVGFTLSPVLWRKLPGAKSAGRVQSVALRLICERVAEIEVFKAR